MNPGQPSQTAQTTAAIRALITALPQQERIVVDPYAAAFLRGAFRQASRLLKVPGVPAAMFRTLELSTPGALQYVGVRHRSFDDTVVEALDSGIKTVVVLGAGYDSRFGRLKREGVRFVEIDHPDTQAAKRAALRESFPDAERSVQYVPVDFERDSWADALGTIDHRGQPVMIVWEGCAWFLSEAAVSNTLKTLSAWAPTGSRIVFDTIDKRVVDGQRTDKDAQAFWDYAEERGEPIRWGEDRASVGSFLQQNEWSLNRVWSASDAAHGYGIARFMRPLSFMFYAYAEKRPATNGRRAV